MPLRLHHLPFGARLGITALLLTLLLGFGASLKHLANHYERRDDRPGLTLDDIRAAYRGIHAPSPLSTALARNHPDKLSPESRKALQTWLAGASLAETYDSLDLGPAAPAEIINASCLSCHARKSDDARARTLPLENWQDVKQLAFERRVDPNPIAVIIASAHAHAIAMGTLGLLLTLLAAATRFPRPLTSSLSALLGLGLLLDLSSWFLARYADPFVPLILISGAFFNISSILLILLLIIDLWRPARASP